MELVGNIDLGLGYTSRTQQVRRISEDWVQRNVYCLRCDSDEIHPTSANTQTRDFVCPDCGHAYELKSKCGPFTGTVVDGAYSAMIRTIRTNRTPSFLLLEYSKKWSVTGLTAVHHSLITENSIVARKPLAATARRAGWIGCSILLPTIAVDARIPVIRNQRIEPRATVRASFKKLETLAELPYKARGWASAVLNLIRRIPGPSFSLTDAYGFEDELKLMYPENNNIKPKIRQQLQVLRDAGVIIFLGSGRYQFADHTSYISSCRMHLI